MSATPISVSTTASARRTTAWLRSNWVIVVCLAVLAIMVLAAVLPYVFFKWKRWL